jgi:cysteine synthase
VSHPLVDPAFAAERSREGVGCDDRRMTSVLDAIGNTPLVHLDHCAPANGAELWLKLECRNPSGSMKDRMALAMIEGAERDGLLSAGDTVVEYTGGSTGPALALVCGAKGYRALIVMADCYTEERFQLLRALGAEVDVVPSIEGRPRVTPRDIANMVERAAELAARPSHYATDQFNNPYIVHDHRDHLGREIWEQTGGRVTAFCQGMGTASSLMGVSEALKPHGVFIQGHEPAGSAAISGGAPGSFVMQGWAGFVMPLWNPDAVDHIEAIPDDEALEMTRRLAREEGIFAGISTGANVVGAHRLAERLGSDAVIVSLAVDTGFKYLSVSPYAELAS